MIRIVHLLDDFAMGGVTRAMSLFDDPRMTNKAVSRTTAIGNEALAPRFDADMIVLHVPPSWERLPFLAALRLRNPAARIVQVEHSYTRGYETSKVRNRGRFRTLLRMAARLVDEIVAVSNAQRNWLMEVGVPSGKVTTIHPWCGRFDLADIPELTRRVGTLQLLAYGRLSPEKNFGALIEALGYFAPTEVGLKLFGAGPCEQQLREAAERSDNVRLMPACTDPAPHLAACDAVVVPSLHEAFGLVATEARMAGRAVLASDVDGLPEQIYSGAGFSVPAATPLQIAEGIQKLLDADLIAMGAAARKTVTAQDVEIIENWHSVIDRVFSSKTSSSRQAVERLQRA